MARLLWFALGAGAAVWGASKVRSSVRAAPQALGRRVAGSAAGVGSSARDFVDRVRALAAEREAELRAALAAAGSDALGLPAPERPPGTSL